MRYITIKSTYFASLFFIAILTTALFTSIFINAQGDITIDEGSFKETASYVIWVDGSTYYAKNGETGQVTSSSNASYLITSIMSDGISLYFKTGDYVLDGYITCYPETTLTFEKWATISASDTLNYVFLISSVNGVTVSGAYIYNTNNKIETAFNLWNTKHDLIEGCIFYGYDSPSSGTTANMFISANSLEGYENEDVIVRDNIIYSGGNVERGYGVLNIFYIYNWKIDGNSIYNSKASAIVMGTNTFSYSITNNYFDTVYNGDAIDVIDSVDFSISDNHIYRTGSLGISIETVLDGQTDVGGVVDSNVIAYCNGSGISCLHTASTDYVTSIILSNNVMFNNGQNILGDAWDRAGIKIDNSSNILIIGNRLFDNQSPSTQNYGIYERGTSTNNTIIGNDAQNNGLVGIYIVGLATKVSDCWNGSTYIPVDTSANINFNQVELQNGVFHTGSTPPSTPIEGQWFYDTDDHTLYVWNSTAWTGILGEGAADHGALTGLEDDDHPQYLLVDGTRSMSGDLNMSQNEIMEGVFHLSSSTPAGPTEGQFYYDTDDHLLYYYNGSDWVSPEGEAGPAGVGTYNAAPYRYVASVNGSGYYIYDNIDLEYELTADTYANLVSTFNTLIAANAGVTFFFTDGTYTGSSATPFTIAKDRGCVIAGEHMYGTRIVNTYSTGCVFKIANEDWEYDGANQIFFKDLTIQPATDGIGIDCYMNGNYEDHGLCLINIHILYAKIGVRYYNPWEHTYWDNVWIRTSNVDDARGVVFAVNHTNTHLGNFYINGLHVHEHGTGANGFIGVELTTNIAGNDHALNVITFIDLEVQAYTPTPDSIGVYMDGNNAVVQLISFIGSTSIEGLDISMYATGNVYAVYVGGGSWFYPYDTGKPNNLAWYASGNIVNVKFVGAYMSDCGISEGDKTIDSFTTDFATVFDTCIITGTIENVTATTRFVNCGPKDNFESLEDCVVNGLAKVTGTINADYYMVGDMMFNGTIYLKGPTGSLIALN